MNKVTRLFRALFQTAEAITLAAFEHGATVVAPVCPAFFFGHAIYTAVAELAAWQLAVAVGASAAFALEAVGIRAFHNALRLGSAVSYVPPALYMVIGIGALITIEGNSDAGVVGVAMFLLTAVLYLTVGISRQATAKVDQTAERVAHQRELQERQFEQEQRVRERQAEREHALKLARIEARKEVKLSGKLRKDDEQVARNVPQLATPRRADWRTLSREEQLNMQHLARQDVVERYGVSERTARNWIVWSRQLSAQGVQNGHVS